VVKLFALFVFLYGTIAYAQDLDFRWNGYPKPASGIVVVDVDKAGKVTGARMLQTTGDRRLDAMALKTFKKWRFKPGTTAPHVKIPITFAPSGTKY